MKRFVSIILNFMIKNNVISKDTEEIEFYRYGIEITLSSLINIALISIIGIITDYTFESMMFLAVFIIMRSFTGGYHANTYVKCNLVTSISFIVLLLMFKIIRHISLKSIILIAVFQVLIIASLAPIENKNKPIENRTVYKIISTVLSVVLSAISIVLIIKGVDLGLIILLTLALVSILIIYARFIKGGISYEN